MLATKPSQRGQIKKKLEMLLRLNTNIPLYVIQRKHFQLPKNTPILTLLVMDDFAFKQKKTRSSIAFLEIKFTYPQC